MWFMNKKPQPAPPQYVPTTYVTYHPDSVRYTQQDHWSYPWPSAVTQYGARVVNCWWGNQLPGTSNFIPGVNMPTWTFQRSLQQTKMVPQNRGQNIGGLSQVQANSLMNAAQQAWWQRTGQGS